MKMPKLKKPAHKQDSLQAPQFLKDLYVDLDDRHLLLPVIALIVAIAAVPFLLGGGSEVPAPSPTAAVDSEDSLQVEPAVLTEAAGIRNYRKRLAALRKKNPFDQQYSGSKPGQESEVAVDDGGAEVAISGETDGSEPVSSAATASGTTSGSTSAEPSDGSGDPSVSTNGETNGEGGSSPVPDGEASFYSGTVDVSFGALGDAKRYKNVKRFTNLPNDRDPVVAFLGLSVDSDRAYFLVSPAVTRLGGEGACPGEGSGCQFLEIAVGEQATLTVGETAPSLRAEATASAADDSAEAPADALTPSVERQAESITYRLKLLDTELVQITDPRDD